MNSRALKQRLAEGKTVFGTMFDYVVNPQWAGIAGNSALDYVVIDAEHGSRDPVAPGHALHRIQGCRPGDDYPDRCAGPDIDRHRARCRG